MRKYLIVGLGGALGALARYGLGNLIKSPAGGFPTATFVINLTGSFGLGFFLTLISERFVVPAEWRLFFATGFVGAYTTFSSFSNEVLTLFRQNEALLAILYSGLSLLFGLMCVWLGFVMARMVIFRRIRLQPKEKAGQKQREQESKARQEAAKTGPTGLLPLEEHTELDPD